MNRHLKTFWQQGKRYYQPILVGVIILFLAFIATYPAFKGSFFALNPDGKVHLGRMESVYQALKLGRLPSLVNFISFSHQGTAVNAMYPWPTLLFFVIPRFIFQSPMMGLAVGFLIMNVITISGAYLLAKKLSNSQLIIWLGVIVYQFNVYHFQVMYTRVALGEAFGYTFLPLILLGLFKIWDHEKKGALYLGLGMGLVANSHVLSLVMFAMLVAGIEIVRLLMRVVDWTEVKLIILGALGAMLLSLYSLYNIIDWLTHNKMVSPTPVFISLNPMNEFQSLINNNLAESADGAHMGIAVALIMLVLLFSLFFRASGPWRYWTIGAVGVLIIAQNWVVWPSIFDAVTPLFQFTMRLLSIVAILVMIGFVLYLDQIKWHSKFGMAFFSVFIIFIAINGVGQTHELAHQKYLFTTASSTEKAQYTKINDSISKLTPKQRTAKFNNWKSLYLTGDNYQQDATSIALASDYHLRKPGKEGTVEISQQNRNVWNTVSSLNHATVMFDSQGARAFKNTFATDQKVGFVSKQKVQRWVKLPVVGYKNVKYQVFVNNKRVMYRRTEGQLAAKLKAGTNHITVSVSTNSRHGFLLLISGLTGLVMLIGILPWHRRRSSRIKPETNLS